MSRTLRNIDRLPGLAIDARRVRTRNGARQEQRAVDEMRACGFEPRPRSTRRPEVTGFSDLPNAGFRGVFRPRVHS